MWGLLLAQHREESNALQKEGFGGAFPMACGFTDAVLFLLPLPDIVIPGTNTSTDVQARISAGESIHIIRGTKGKFLCLGNICEKGLGQC